MVLWAISWADNTPSSRAGAGGMRLAVAVAVTFVLTAALVAGCSAAQHQPTLAGVVRSQPLDVAAISLPDVANGDSPLRMQPPPGELLLVYFGYTYCPDICPTTMSDISIALGDLPPALGERVSVAMVTVDPERDTDERLTDYMGFFFTRAHALRTTDEGELDRAARAFGVRWEVESHAPGERYDVAHTAITYVVDDTGTVVVEWPFGFDHELMTADLTILLEAKET